MPIPRSTMFTLAAIAAALPLGGAANDLSGPHSYQNLTIFLIHGKDQSPRSFLTLQEALERKKIVVYETGNVNELAVENLSSTEEIFIQSGDIVKGGRQDRTFKDDVILTSNSGKVPIASFCVEHGRWSRRGQEASGNFASSSQSVATRDLKRAVKLSADQAEVWNKVAEAQHKMSANLATAVAAPASPTSYMLSLENGKLQKSVEEYVGALNGIVNTHRDVIGYVFAVNGKMSGAEIYANHDLFQKLWPKLLRASAVEAVSERDVQVPLSAPTLADAHTFLSNAGRGKESPREVNSRTRVTTRESEKNAMFETQDRAAQNGWLHRSYLAK